MFKFQLQYLSWSTNSRPDYSEATLIISKDDNISELRNNLSSNPYSIWDLEKREIVEYKNISNDTEWLIKYILVR